LSRSWLTGGRCLGGGVRLGPVGIVRLREEGIDREGVGGCSGVVVGRG